VLLNIKARWWTRTPRSFWDHSMREMAGYIQLAASVLAFGSKELFFADYF